MTEIKYSSNPVLVFQDVGGNFSLQHMKIYTWEKMDVDGGGVVDRITRTKMR